MRTAPTGAPTPAYEVMTTKQLAAYLSISVEKATELLRGKQIRSMRIGDDARAEWRTTKSWVGDWMESRAAGGPAEADDGSTEAEAASALVPPRSLRRAH